MTFAALNEVIHELGIRTGHLYFADDGTAIKIGWSEKPRARVAQLQAGNPRALRIVGTVPCGAGSELRLHALQSSWLSRRRVRGEWYDRNAAMTFLRRLRRVRRMLAASSHVPLDPFALEGFALASWLTTGEVCEALGVRPRLLYEAVARNELSSGGAGRRALLFQVADVRDWLRRRANA